MGDHDEWCEAREGGWASAMDKEDCTKARREMLAEIERLKAEVAFSTKEHGVVNVAWQLCRVERDRLEAETERLRAEVASEVARHEKTALDRHVIIGERNDAQRDNARLRGALEGIMKEDDDAPFSAIARAALSNQTPGGEES